MEALSEEASAEGAGDVSRKKYGHLLKNCHPGEMLCLDYQKSGESQKAEIRLHANEVCGELGN
jgi:hypothetical protein